MRVVFDTNIFVSALVFPGGQAEQALLRVIEDKDQLIISKAIIDELLRVLAVKFSRDREELARVAVHLSDLGKLVRPRRQVEILEDDADNRILECAAAGRADVIVTGDLAMLALRKYEDIRIMRLRDYLQLT